jgi:hypothetical protein
MSCARWLSSPSPGGGRSKGGLRPPSFYVKNADAERRLREAWRDGVKARAARCESLHRRAPHPASLRAATLPLQGRVKQARSRGALRARVLQQERKPRIFRLQIKREAERRKAQIEWAAPHEQMSPPVRATGAARATDDPLTRTARFGRARLSALHRGSGRAFTPDSAPGQASWDAGPAGVTRPRLSQSSGSTPRTGHNTGGHDAQNRPGAVCETARGNRTRSTFRIASRKRPC